MHALQPLQAANSRIHVFTSPALWANALWLPYRRGGSPPHAAIHKLRMVTVGISGGKLLTRSFRDARRLPYPEL